MSYLILQYGPQCHLVKVYINKESATFVEVNAHVDGSYATMCSWLREVFLTIFA